MIIGAYYGENQIGLNGKDRPIIDGNNNEYPANEQGLIEVFNQKYVTIQDLTIQHAGQAQQSVRGVYANASQNINTENCNLYRNRCAILYLKVDTGTISRNIVEEAGYPGFAGTGAAVEISAANSAGATTNITVSHNLVSNSKHEGIGFYKKVTNSVAEYNVLHDMRSYHLYSDSSQYITFRYNLIYETAERADSSFNESEYAMALNNEQARGYEYSGHYKVYGNLVAGMARGVSFGCGL